MKIAPAHPTVLSRESVSGANWLEVLGSLFARLLIDLNANNFEIEVTLNDALLEAAVQIGTPV